MSNANFNPDSLLKDINKSILTKGIVIALVAHAIIIFGTSFSLYRDWVAYRDKEPVGFIKKPSTIKTIIRRALPCFSDHSLNRGWRKSFSANTDDSSRLFPAIASIIAIDAKSLVNSMQIL